MNIHQLDLNSFRGRQMEVEIPPFLAPKSSDQENCEKTPFFETKAAVSFHMPQGVLCLKHLFGL